MITLKSLLCEQVKKISLQKAVDNKLFGPVYHGTNQEALSKIDKEGFKVIMGLHGTSGMSHGYEYEPYGYFTDVPPPIHHLGFGVYFTTVKAIAKRFAGGTAKGMKAYFLDIPKKETINFASPRKMMKWWIENGYDPELAKRGEGGRYMATAKMTEQLKSKYEGVWFKGKGIHRLLDGDQVVVFDPKDIYEIDLSLSKEFDLGAKVKAKIDIKYTDKEGNVYGSVVPIGTTGIIVKRYDVKKNGERISSLLGKRCRAICI
jgi:hypothetical protein